MIKKRLTALFLSVCMAASAFTAGAGQAGTLYTTAAAKPKLAITSVSVAVKGVKTVKIKNVSKNKVKKLTVKSSNQKYVTAKVSGKTAVKVTGVRAGKTAKVKISLKLKKKIAGKISYRFTLKVKVKQDTKTEASPAASAESSPSASPDSNPSAAPVNGVTDYSKTDNWLHLPEQTQETKKVDTFYIYPTVYLDDSNEATDIASIDNAEMRERAKDAYATQAVVFEGATNVYAPYYRQSNINAIKGLREKALEEYQKKEQYEDLCAALDYYFTNQNDGRPFIIAGHSQGAIMTKLLLEGYMKEHPEYYKRMVAAYALGFSVTKEDLSTYPHLKFAEGADDTGVIVSWNLEGKGNKDADNLVVEEGAVSINPLNWKRDETVASAGENLGSRIADENGGYQIVMNETGAVLDTARGVVVVEPKTVKNSIADLFGPESYHNYDYGLFFNNIRQNVKTRIASYFAKEENAVSALGEIKIPAEDYSKEDNWLSIPETKYAVDTIYFYPTAFNDPAEDAPYYCAIDTESMRAGAKRFYNQQAVAFTESTNVYAPYYRQCNLAPLVKEGLDSAGFTEKMKAEPRSDTFAALDYYFTHYNNGRPFIFASHSQGSNMMRIILSEYMKAHPEYYERMIAAYVIGYAISESYLKANPHLKFAEGEKDTGVIISWNTEGAGNHDNFLVEEDSVSINPINWKRDETPAGREESEGSYWLNNATGEFETYKKPDGLGSARVDKDRGVVVTDADEKFLTIIPALDGAQPFGPKSFHGVDYALFFYDIVKNVQVRTESYLLY
ncbi:MAG: DUF3089 domain-containing protein [Lachnospiraceae bacterium]|nr:DUF3089 domain-containing protein [Lachnospiraceae bacterium]